MSITWVCVVDTVQRFRLQTRLGLRRIMIWTCVWEIRQDWNSIAIKLSPDEQAPWCRPLYSSLNMCQVSACPPPPPPLFFFSKRLSTQFIWYIYINGTSSDWGVNWDSYIVVHICTWSQQVPVFRINSYIGFIMWIFINGAPSDGAKWRLQNSSLNMCLVSACPCVWQHIFNIVLLYRYISNWGRYSDWGIHWDR